MKINVLLLNNTEHYHSGCKKVIDYFRYHFLNHTLTVHPKKTKEFPNFNNFDLIILNGEGSCHDDSKKIISYLEYMNEASIAGIKTMVVNSVWQNNSKSTTELLQKINYISVREIKSKNEILKYIDKKIEVAIDLSYFHTVEFEESKPAIIVAGNKFIPKKQRELYSNIGEESYIDIFSEDWKTIVNKLRNSEVLITGLHHEVYAACKAECPFIAIEGNTHKISGILETFNIDIPVLNYNSTNNVIVEHILNIDQYKNEYTNLFKKMKQQLPPNFIEIYKCC
jgi:polysaccharide pyruvyl transferase WcaK-like protein